MITPEAQTSGAKELLSSEFGKWLVSEIQRLSDAHIKLGQGTDAHNLQVNELMRSAGNIEVLKLITHNAAIADSSLMKK